ncbi:DUF6634 family protein [Neorhizobium sp. NCHU2750]|uniref:DUF6634 family protein n=1 Tax=Neorhizobium sp. NCHU2750 TaxID=1825976 RepID=UPI0032D9FA1E
MKLRYAPVEALSRLVDDLRLAEAASLSISDISDSPILHSHRILPMSVGILEGIVEGHPKLGTGRPITTSQVFYLDTELGIARTLSRWYRLGVSAETGRH